MQPAIVFQGTSVEIAAHVTTVDLFKQGSYGWFDERDIEPFNSAHKRRYVFVPYLVMTGARKTGAEARPILPQILREKNLKVGSSLHLAAFCLAYPDYPGPEHRDPINAMGDPTEVPGVNGPTTRIVSIFWGPHDGRSVYTFFDCARFGPLVSYLMIEELEAA